MQQLRSTREGMEGSTDETMERHIWSRSLKQWLGAKMQTAVARLPESTSLVHLNHHHASSSRRRAVRVWRIGGPSFCFIRFKSKPKPLGLLSRIPRRPAMARLLVRRRPLDCETARVLCAHCGLLTAACGLR